MNKQGVTLNLLLETAVVRFWILLQYSQPRQLNVKQSIETKAMRTTNRLNANAQIVVNATLLEGTSSYHYPV